MQTYCNNWYPLLFALVLSTLFPLIFDKYIYVCVSVLKFQQQLCAGGVSIIS